jgi:hypothetical protein
MLSGSFHHAHTQTLQYAYYLLGCMLIDFYLQVFRDNDGRRAHMIAIHKYPRSFDFHKQPGKKPAVKLHTSQHRRNSSNNSTTSSHSSAQYDMSSSSGLHRESNRAAATVQCKFQTSAGGCRRGNDCPFKHAAAKPRGRIMQELELNDDESTTDDVTAAAADNSSITLQLEVAYDASVMISDTDADCGGSRSMEQSLSPCKQSSTTAVTVDSSEEHQINSNSHSDGSNRGTRMEVEAVDDDLNTAMRRLYIPREMSFGRGRGRHRLSGFYLNTTSNGSTISTATIV